MHRLSSQDLSTYVDDMAARSKATIWAKVGMGSLDLQSLVTDHKAQIDAKLVDVYYCGPGQLLYAVEDTFQPHLTARHVHVEGFALLEVDASTNTAFDVVPARSGRCLHVPVDKNILEVVHEAGDTTAVLLMCTKGTCVRCETRGRRGRASRYCHHERREGGTEVHYVMGYVCRGAKGGSCRWTCGREDGGRCRGTAIGWKGRGSRIGWQDHCVE